MMLSRAAGQSSTVVKHGKDVPQPSTLPPKPTHCKYLMNDIPRDVSRIKLLNSLLVPPHGQDMTPATQRPQVLCGCIMVDSRLDDELSVATIAFSDTPKWLRDLNCDRNGFPKISTFGTIWRAVDLEHTDEQGRTEFHRAVMAGNLLRAEMLAEFEKTDPNIQDEQHRTGLHWACALGLLDMVMLCLSIPGCDIGLKDSEGLTAFDLSRQSDHGSAEAIQTLFYKSMFELEQENPQGALLQILTLSSDPVGDDKLIFPGEAIFEPIVDCNSPLVIALINRGIDLTATNPDGDTALHLASAIVENTEIATRLLEAGSDVNAVGNGGATPIHHAASGDAQMVQLLLRWDADVTIKDDHDKSPLHWAEQNGRLDITRILLQHGVNVAANDETGRMTLDPAEESQVSEADLVVQRKAEMDMMGQDRSVAVSLASQESQQSNGDLVVLEVVTQLGDQDQDQTHRIQPEKVDAEITNPLPLPTLHEAVENSDLESVRLLLEQGADVEALNGKGSTPLMVAARTGSVEILNALLACGAQTGGADELGWTALHFAAGNGHPMIIDALIASGSAIEVTDDESQTAVYLAARWGRTSAIEALLLGGAEAETAISSGKSALSAAAMGGHTTIVNLLLACGASAEAADDFGWTALHGAAVNGNEDTVRALRAGGAQIDTASEHGTPLELALMLGRVEVVELLTKWGAGTRDGLADVVEHDDEEDLSDYDDRQNGVGGRLGRLRNALRLQPIRWRLPGQ